MAEDQSQTRASSSYIWSRTRAVLAWVSAWVALWALVACTTPYEHAQLRPPNAGFAGIDDSFSSQTPEVDVLLIHGMGTHTESWVQSMVNQLAPALGFTTPADLPPPDPLKPAGRLYRYLLTDGNRHLGISAVLWSPITSPAKATLCYDVNQPTSLCTDRTVFSKDKRAWANALIKSQILYDRLSDVTFYLNEDGHHQILAAIQDALLRSLSTERMSVDQLRDGRTPTAKTAPLFILSESLGSKIVVDALRDFESRPQTRDFANQTRGLNLGVEPSARAERRYPHLDEFAVARNAYRNPRLPDVPLHVVAFSDPNDLFSYQLAPDAILEQHAIISNVIVSNDYTIVGLYENPLAAHTCYLQNSPVANAIAHGSALLSIARTGHCP
jgi:hypothetical protein